MSTLLTPSGLISTAKTFTELAIQNNMIAAYSEPEETAKSVATFYKTLLKELNPIE